MNNEGSHCDGVLVSVVQMLQASGEDDSLLLTIDQRLSKWLVTSSSMRFPN